MNVLADVSEVFSSVQGEGAYALHPSIFFRFHRCNLRCVWCDTKYTWDETHPEYNDFKSLSIPQAVKTLRELQVIGLDPQMRADVVARYGEDVPPSFERNRLDNLVFTGGEPLLWRRYILELLPVIQEHFATIEFETNGTLPPLSNNLSWEYDIHYNVSPKLPHAGNEGLKTINPLAIRAFVETERTRWKFVADDPYQNLETTGSLLGWVGMLTEQYDVSRDDIWLMPLGETQQQLLQSAPGVKAFAEEHGLRFTDRLHVHMWGAERGV